MLLQTKDLRGFKLSGLDQDFGKVKEFYFDDILWKIRYLVADTGNWLTGREVLLSPRSIIGVDESARQVNLNLTREKVENSPSIMEDQPVSRQNETDLAVYYSWPTYWDMLAAEYPQNPNLRSTKEVTNYTIEAIDGELGRIKNFIVDDIDWDIRYMQVNTGKWLPGKKVLIALPWITEIDEETKTVKVDVHRSTIESAPVYDPEKPLDREAETALFDHYNKEYYWGV